MNSPLWRPPAHSQELPTTEKKSTRQPRQPITPSAPLTRCLRRISGVEITLSQVLFIKHRRSLGGNLCSNQWEDSHVRPCGSPERGTLCSFTSVRTQFFCFLQYHLLGLQGPVATLTELPWSENHHNRKTSRRPMCPSSRHTNCLCAHCSLQACPGIIQNQKGRPATLSTICHNIRVTPTNPPISPKAISV
jgi:hypothetical protein